MKNLASTLRIQKFLPLCLLLSANVTAADQNHLAQQKIMQLAESYISEQLQENPDPFTEVQVEAMQLDSRIQITPCPLPYEVSTNSPVLGQTNITVKASCPSNDWFLYFLVRVTEMQQVVVASSAFSPGTIVTEDNIVVQMMNKQLLRTSGFHDKEQLLGARIKRRIRPGQPIQPYQLCYVCKGDSITITASIEGLEIKTSGIAQEDGNIGDTIRVLNTSSNKSISAEVRDTNSVLVHI